MAEGEAGLAEHRQFLFMPPAHGAALAASHARLVAGPFVRLAVLMRCATTFTCDFSLFLWVHRRKSSAVALSILRHRAVLLISQVADGCVKHQMPERVGLALRSRARTQGASYRIAQ